ncbi:MAG: N-acetylmuramoyl-L-alanine amidase [Acidobacteriota bacterium]
MIILLCISAVTLTGISRDRNAAREAYLKADQYHDQLMKESAGSRTRSQYITSITMYRRVIDNDPSYGACDDALYTMATIYDEMAERYSSTSDRNKAIYYYEFVAREYPYTKYKNTARQRAGELRRVPEKAASTTKKSPTSQAVTAARINSGPQAVLSDVRFWSNEDYTRVVLQLDKETEFQKEVLSNPDRIFFDLLNSRMDRKLINRSYDVNGLFINQIRVGVNRPGVVRVVLDFDAINQHTVFALYNPFRIVIDTRGLTKSDSAAASNTSGSLENPPPAETPTPPGPGAVPTHDGKMTLTRTLGLKVGKVVIDPGHGGKDPGVTGPSGLKEKDLVLDVGLKLRDYLVNRLGIEVVMTRDKDIYVPLEERTAIANQIGADLFISIHANGSPNRRVRGIETFVLDFSSSEDERRVASMENAGSQSTIAALEELLKSIARDDYKQESRDLAQIVQTHLHGQLSKSVAGQANRGVKQAPFIVLIGSNMPSILTEVGFISNPSDEKYFKSDTSRNLLAEALYTGVENYFQSLGNFQTAYRASDTGN